MALASYVKVVLGSIAFAIFWELAVFPAVPFLPVGRTAGSMVVSDSFCLHYLLCFRCFHFSGGSGSGCRSLNFNSI